jgi:hypothetical protein
MDQAQTLGHWLSTAFCLGQLALGCWMLSLVIRPAQHDDTTHENTTHEGDR